MAKMAAITGCGNAQHYDSLAGSVAAAVDSLYDPTSGLFLASDVLELVRYVSYLHSFCRSLLTPFSCARCVWQRLPRESEFFHPFSQVLAVWYCFLFGI